MPFEAYLPQGFVHSHENRMFHELATSLAMAFGSGAIPVYLLGNVMFGDKELDAVLLMPDALFVVEMKSYGGLIHFSENVEWFADETEVLGGIYRNPYCQLRANKFAFLDYLQRKAPEILNRGTVNHWWYVCGVVLFGRDIQFDEKLPEAISDWFAVCDQHSVVGAISSFRRPRFVSAGYVHRPFTGTELGRIVGGLGLTARHLYTGTAAAAAPTDASAPPLEVPPLKVLFYNQSNFRSALLRLRQSGGRKTAGAMTLLNAIQDARNGVDTFSTIQSVQDARIENAIIYFLNEEARCVAVKNGSIIHLCHCGTPQEVGLWIQANAGKTFTVDAETHRIEPTVVTIESSQAVLAPTHMTEANLPFLARVSGLDLEKLVSSVLVRKHLMRLDENSSDADINELLREITDEDVQLFLHDVISLAKAGDIAGAETRVRLRKGDACPVVDAPAMAETALVAEANSDQIVVLNELDQDEFDRLFDPLRFREWMVFLHPGQRRVSDEDFAGPALLTGVSGSGKTCVLVHRARRLAQFFSQDRILILTLNQSLARLIEVLKDDLCLGPEKGRIEVKAFHDYLSEVLSSLDCAAFLRRLAEFTGMSVEVEAFLAKTTPAERTKMFKPVTEREQMIAFEEFLAEPGNPAKVEFDRLEVFVFSQDQTIDLRRYLFEELELVRSAFTCDTDYRGYCERVSGDSSELKYKREGRSVGFQENRRQAILGILREWERFQLRRGFLDMMGLVQAAVFAVEEQGAIPEKFRYRSVLVDEFQDLSTLEISLLRQIPKFTENGLFLTGDFAQKIYAKDLNLPAAKLGRDARTDRIIRRNYRNSRQVLLAAQALLEAYPPQLAGGEDDVAVLKPEYASKESAVPIATQASDPIRAAWHYAEEWLRGGHVPFSVCIATANAGAISTESILKHKPATMDADVLTGDYLLNPSRVVVADISAVKGFEFSLILICGLDDGVFPPKGVPAAEHWREAMRLYVAITRGRDEVRFIYKNTPSPFLTVMANKIQFQTWEAPPLPVPVGEPVVEPVVEPIIVTTVEITKVETPTTIPVPQKPEVAPKREALVDFYDQFKPEVLNGILVMPIPKGATQWELARALGQHQTAVSIACQGLEYFTPPNRPLPDHIIRGVCDYFRCVPNIISFHRNVLTP
jgi:superfamily I DNA/RNA helicase